MGHASKLESFVPTPEGQKEARKYLNYVRSGKAAVPPEIKEMIVEALERFSEGQSVVIGSSENNYTTQEAADFLQVSRKHLIKMLDDEVLPFFRVGAHRRIKAADVLAYKRQLDDQRLRFLEKMTAIAEEAENGDDE